MAASVRVKRGSRAQIDAAATGGGLAAGELYLATDEGRLAVGTSANGYKATAMESELSPFPAFFAAAGLGMAELSAHITGGSTTNTAISADTLYVIPYRVPRTGMVPAVVVQCGTAAAGKSIRAIVWPIDGAAGWPVASLGETASLSVGSTGTKSLALPSPISVNEGAWLYIGLASDGAPSLATIPAAQIGASPLGCASPIATALQRNTRLIALLSPGWANLPAVPSKGDFGPSTNTSIPAIALQYQ